MGKIEKKSLTSFEILKETVQHVLGDTIQHLL